MQKPKQLFGTSLMGSFEQWSAENLGQWHYVLGYSIVLLSHNWPIFLALGLCVWFGIKLYRNPTRYWVSWFFSALLFGLAYEYYKHVALELHRAIDQIFMFELLWISPLLHVLVGPVVTALLSSLALAFAYNALWIRFSRGRGTAKQHAPGKTRRVR
jgi:hypothetical protein